MFLRKNTSSFVTGNNMSSGRTNYGFSCGSTRTNVTRSTLSYTTSGNTTSGNTTNGNTTSGSTTSGNTTNDVFNSLNNQLNNNIRTINRNSNSMFPKKRGGCGCGSRK